MAGTFEKTSFDWQLQRVQMQISEWFERLFYPPQGVKVPNWSLPEGLLRILFWGIAIALVAWAGWQLYRLVAPYWHNRVLANRKLTTKPEAVAKQMTEAQWLERSRSLAQQGNFREACRALYHAALQKLDESGMVPAQLSLTDGEYLNCVQILPNPRPYQALIRVHEQLCFSTTPITQETFTRCQQAYRETEA